MALGVSLISCLVTAAQAQVRGNLRETRVPAVVTIKHFGIGTPVTGGGDSFALLQLDKPASGNGVTIHLSSNNVVVTVPATITVAAGTADRSFQVTTGPVTVPTVVTVSAQVPGVSAAQTATVTVVPPSLAGVSCTPTSVPGGSPVKCTVRLNGPLAAPALGAAGDKRVAQMNGSVTGLELESIALSTSNAGVATVPPTVRLGSGQHSATFDVTTVALPQSASATISAAYGGLTKSTTIAVQPVSLLSVQCTSGCELGAASGQAPDPLLGMIVTLTAPAPSSGFTIQLTDNPNLLTFWTHPPEGGAQTEKLGVIFGGPSILHVRAGQRTASFDIRPRAMVKVPTMVTVSASHSTTEQARTVQVKLKRLPSPRMESLHLNLAASSTGSSTYRISGVPLGGQRVMGSIRFDGRAPDGGLSVDVTCFGATDITCPDRIIVAEGHQTEDFTITVYPCALTPPCLVKLNASSGMDSKTLAVNVYP